MRVENTEYHCPGFLTLPTAYVTGNPVECVIHPDLWNKSTLWDPLGIGRVSLDPTTQRNLDDEYVEENYGSPINTVSFLEKTIYFAEKQIF